MAFSVTLREFFVVICACLQTIPICAFNLETRLPILKFGPKGSYFGYSVAEHQIIPDNGRKESLLLIGAPKHRTYAHNYSGGIFSCALSSNSEDCQEIQFEEDVDYGDRLILKNDQWLGVTVNSQGPGGYIMVCAHRFIIAGIDYQWGQGICYSLEQDLQYSRAWEPCNNLPVNKAHEQYGYCQAGTSGEITEDSTIVIGTPGPFTWRGTVFTNNVRFRSLIGHSKRWHSGPHQEENSPVDKYSYLGMSVTSGIFFGNQKSFVSGAPRSNGTGQVVFFRKKPDDTTFLVEMILDGEQFASSFGYTLTSLDTNNDGHLDLVVGAPFYYDKGEGGAVYIYMNSGQGVHQLSNPVKMTGKLESRFGFALENAGDLNGDGYVDLAVGAPYEKGGGALYIYLGSKDGLVMKPSQVIYGKDIPNVVDLKTFGYSLDGGIDMDGNEYPDLLVGAYESNTVILLRSRPVLDIITSVTGDLTNIDPDKKGCEKDKNSPTVCFSFEACFKFNSTVASLASTVKLQCKIEAETFTGRKYFRVRFRTADPDTPNIFIKQFTVRGSALTGNHCFEEIVYLKDKSDIQNPIQFQLSYSLMQKDPAMPYSGTSLPDIDAYPILNQQEASRIFEAKFLKDCGSNDICESVLRVVADINLPRNEFGDPVLYLGEKQVALSVKVMRNGDPAYDAMLYVIHPPSLSYVGRKVVKGEQIECVPFNSTVVSCELGNPLKEDDVELQVKFNPKDVSDSEKSLKLTVKANTTSVEISRQNDTILEIAIVKVAELEIRGASETEQSFYGGETHAVPVYEEDVGNEVIHKYEIINHGPLLASHLEVVVSWPYEKADSYEHGKWLLYITENPVVTGNGYCKLTDSQRNPLKLKKRPQELRSAPDAEPSRQRQKRNAEPEELRTDGKSLKVVTLDCERDTAKCFKFSCFFKNLERGTSAIMKIKARLWNSTFVEDYASVDHVVIISRAHIQAIPEDIRQKEDNDFAMVDTKAFPDIHLYQKPEEVPLWIIILSACGGILLLIILIIILWKCGFFKRKKPGYEPAPTNDKDFM